MYKLTLGALWVVYTILLAHLEQGQGQLMAWPVLYHQYLTFLTFSTSPET